MSASGMPCLVRSNEPDAVPVELGDDVVDGYLRFVWARARHNALLAIAFDLKVFFTEVAQGTGRGDGSRRAGVHRVPASPTPWRQRVAPRGRRGWLVGVQPDVSLEVRLDMLFGVRLDV